MAKPIFAVIGRPNVGKSTLFNKLIGKRISIVEDTPGVTRDRIYADGEWLGKTFVLIDTGGIEPKTGDGLVKKMMRQAEIAIESADVIIMLADISTGVTADDQAVAVKLKKSKKPVILCVNKMDSVGSPPPEFYEFYNLGLGEPMPVSSVHGHGTGDLLDAAFAALPEGFDNDSEEEEKRLSLAIIGKPNVGKSSLTNQILREERMIVSDIAGTTRDAIENKIDNKYGSFTVIDTAGVRKKNKIMENIEKYSIIRAFSAVDRADVAIVMIDATIGITEQDTKLAGYAHNRGKPSVIAVNKWDLVDKNNSSASEYKNKILSELPYMTYAPIIFISAKNGQRVDRIFEEAVKAYEQNSRRIKTGILNEVLADATLKVQPPSDKGRRLKIYYMTQTGINPPTFTFFVNDKELFHFSYMRYLLNRLREVFGFEGTPLKTVVRQKGENPD